MSRHVLIVDDEEDIRTILAAQLALLGFQSTCAADGEKGLLILNSGRIFDMIFLDVNMPRIDGFALVRTLRQGSLPSKNTPVCMLTGDCERSIIVRTAGLGGTDFLLKPWSMDDLALKLKSTSSTQTLTFSEFKNHLSNLHVEEKKLFTATELSAFDESTHRPFLVSLGERRFCFVIRKGIKPASIAALSEKEAAEWVSVFYKQKSKWVFCWPPQLMNQPIKN